VNNYNPTGLSTADVLRLESSGTPRNITGLAGGADGRIIQIHNIGATYNVILVNESASSDADKRFSMGGNDVNVGPGQAVNLQYDSILSRWYLTATQDHTKLTNVGNYSHTQVDSHIDNSGVHVSFSDAEGDPAAVAVTAADGTSAYAARRDHVHTGNLLAYKFYAGGNKATVSATIEDADATNLAVTFTAPASGNVLVRLTAQSIPDTGANHQGAQHQWGLRESTTTIAGPHTVSRDTAGNGYTFVQAASVAFPITGLTPGNSYTYKWAHLVTASGTASIGASSNNGPAVMEVWALP
jgi:hypothetical protein